MEQLAWPILLLPFLAFVLISLITLPYHRLSGAIAILSIFGSLVLSAIVLASVLSGSVALPLHTGFEWIRIGNVSVDVGLVIDQITAVMLIVVTLVSFLVQVFSQGYMHGDAGYPRYYAFISLFTFSMLGLVLADNLLLMFMFWEGVGLCSYLLIGFWFAKPEAAAAAKKAFIVTRFGDLGFIIGFLILFAIGGTFNIRELHELAEAGKIGGTLLTLGALGLFAGAVGKSAQFPLHVWLPDAMEGPTPVSALIHAATMVAAGVYLVARMYPIFEHAPTAMLAVAVIGGFTALFAATMGIVMTDIKKVMAYSTISQLGYMMLGLGVGSLVAGIFHLFTHAFFKALLFLGSGSVIHATGTQDMREMGGLRQYMPVTFVTLGLASLSLAGIFPFAGFWSKDEILAIAFHNGYYVLWLMGLIGAFITAFYITRLMILTFFGKYRGQAHAEAHATVDHGAGHGHTTPAAHGLPVPHVSHGLPHESPWVMIGPMIVLAVLSVCAGWLNIGGGFASFLGEHPEPIDVTMALLSTVVALAGIGFAYLVYGSQRFSAAAIRESLSDLHTLVVNKYYFDDLYGWIARQVVLGIASLLAWTDRTIVDGIVNFVARIWVLFGAGLRHAQTGKLQAYGLATFAGVFLIALGLLILGGKPL